MSIIWDLKKIQVVLTKKVNKICEIRLNALEVILGIALRRILFGYWRAPNQKIGVVFTASIHSMQIYQQCFYLRLRSHHSWYD